MLKLILEMHDGGVAWMSSCLDIEDWAPWSSLRVSVFRAICNSLRFRTRQSEQLLQSEEIRHCGEAYLMVRLFPVR
jgi:hypothetical protein